MASIPEKSLFYWKDNEIPVMRKLLRSIEHHRAHILEKAEFFSGNRGYDDGKIIEKLWSG